MTRIPVFDNQSNLIANHVNGFWGALFGQYFNELSMGYVNSNNSYDTYLAKIGSGLGSIGAYSTLYALPPLRAIGLTGSIAKSVRSPIAKAFAEHAIKGTVYGAWSNLLNPNMSASQKMMASAESGATLGAFGAIGAKFPKSILYHRGNIFADTRDFGMKLASYNSISAIHHFLKTGDFNPFEIGLDTLTFNTFFAALGDIHKKVEVDISSIVKQQDKINAEGYFESFKNHTFGKETTWDQVKEVLDNSDKHFSELKQGKSKDKIGTINASEVAAIVGKNPFNSRLSVLAKRFFNINISNKEAVKRGIENESKALELLRKNLGVELHKKSFSKDKMSATPDGFIDGFGDKKIVEVKTPSGDVKDSTIWLDYINNKKIPEQYIIQMQMQMYCAEAQSGIFCLYDANKGEIHTSEVPYSKQDAMRYVAECEAFRHEVNNGLTPVEELDRYRDAIFFNEKYKPMTMLDAFKEIINFKIKKRIDNKAKIPTIHVLNQIYSKMNQSNIDRIKKELEIISKGNADSKKVEEIMHKNREITKEDAIVMSFLGEGTDLYQIIEKEKGVENALKFLSTVDKPEGLKSRKKIKKEMEEMEDVNGTGGYSLTPAVIWKYINGIRVGNFEFDKNHLNYIYKNYDTFSREITHPELREWLIDIDSKSKKDSLTMSLRDLMIEGDVESIVKDKSKQLKEITGNTKIDYFLYGNLEVYKVVSDIQRAIDNSILTAEIAKQHGKEIEKMLYSKSDKQLATYKILAQMQTETLPTVTLIKMLGLHDVISRPLHESWSVADNLARYHTDKFQKHIDLKGIDDLNIEKLTVNDIEVEGIAIGDTWKSLNGRDQVALLSQLASEEGCRNMLNGKSLRFKNSSETLNMEHLDALLEGIDGRLKKHARDCLQWFGGFFDDTEGKRIQAGRLSRSRKKPFKKGENAVILEYLGIGDENHCYFPLYAIGDVLSSRPKKDGIKLLQTHSASREGDLTFSKYATSLDLSRFAIDDVFKEIYSDNIIFNLNKILSYQHIEMAMENITGTERVNRYIREMLGEYQRKTRHKSTAFMSLISNVQRGYHHMLLSGVITALSNTTTSLMSMAEGVKLQDLCVGMKDAVKDLQKHGSFENIAKSRGDETLINRWANWSVDMKEVPYMHDAVKKFGDFILKPFEFLDKFTQLFTIRAVDNRFKGKPEYEKKLDAITNIHFFGNTPMHQTALRRHNPFLNLMIPFATWGSHMAGVVRMYKHEKVLYTLMLPAIADGFIKCFIAKLWDRERDLEDVLKSNLFYLSGFGFAEEALEYFIQKGHTRALKNVLNVGIVKDAKNIYKKITKINDKNDKMNTYVHSALPKDQPMTLDGYIKQKGKKKSLVDIYLKI